MKQTASRPKLRTWRIENVLRIEQARLDNLAQKDKSYDEQATFCQEALNDLLTIQEYLSRQGFRYNVK